MTDVPLNVQIRALVKAQEEAADKEQLPGEAQNLDFEKWRLIHKYVHRHPFPTRASLKRSEQWREAAGEIRDIGEIELLDWCLLQVAVASNLERGIQDMRPRKAGPCHPLILEYVANRKRKALAVLHFSTAGQSQGAYGVNSEFHARTEEILAKAERNYEAHDEGHEALPWEPGEGGEQG